MQGQKSRWFSMFLAMSLVGGVLFHSGNLEASTVEELDLKAQTVKKALLYLGKDMQVFERVALYPDERRLSVFLTMDVGNFFSLSRVKLKLDDKWVVDREFHDHESAGMEKGAAIRLYVGNLEEGQHKLLAFFEGVGPRQRPYKRGLKQDFRKTAEPVFMEMRINDSEKRLQPEFLVKQW